MDLGALDNTEKNIVYSLALERFPDDIRYIGATVRTLRVRMQGHRRAALHNPRRTPVRDWVAHYGIAAIRAATLEVVANPDELMAAERRHIAMALEAGEDLLNLTQGGEGVWGFRLSDVHKLAISQSLTGRTLSDAHKAAISAGLTGKRHSEESRAKMRTSARNRRT
jgi:hypothetical protein